MHPTILIQRKAQAINRIMAKAEALAKHLDLDPALIDSLQPKGVKDSQVIEMFRLEGLANLFDQLAISAGISEPVTVVTPAGDESPAGEVEPTADEAETPIPIAMGPDGLPAPTLEEAPTAEEQPVEVIDEEAVAPEEPATEQPVEVIKKTAPAVPKKSTRKRSKK
jgi:hypothetical protein